MSEGENSFLEKLKPETRKKFVLSAIIIGFGIFGTLYFYSAEDEKRVVESAAEQYTGLEVDSELYEEDINKTINASRQEAHERNTAIDTRLTDQNKKMNEQEEKMAALHELIEGLRQQDNEQKTNNESISFPPAPSYTVNQDFQTGKQQSGNQGPEIVEAPTLIGGITHIKTDEKLIRQDLEKKKGKKIYLPPSFMQATLLTGMDASTTEGANEHPQPLMIRVQEPAVLPNTIKADLQGCFVVAHGYGALNKERIETRLVSLNCLSKDGGAIIDTAVKGYVTDSDGKSGLKGLVVSKQGAHLARVFAAGVFGGIGKIAEQSGQTVTVGPVTTTTSITPGDAMTAGIGAGIADSSKDLRRFFLDLAKQASPVISVGPAKKLTVVITEGVWLDIRENKDV